LNEQEQKSILTICLMAAFADGAKHEREREEVKRVASSLAGDGSTTIAPLYQDVLLKRVSLQQATAALTSPETRQLAFEMAVCVCDADGAQSDKERAFLNDLRNALQLDAGEAQAYTAQAEAIAAAPIDSPAVPVEPAAAAPLFASTMTLQEMDKTILNAAILNGAIELLPESLSTMAIIPLQMRLVYNIGKSHGFDLDRGHIKDFLATIGVGLTSQYLEQAGRKLLGGLLGKVGGGMLRGVGRQAVSSGMSFATTYALGHVAKRYYGGGRTLSTEMLRESFDGLLAEAKDLQTRYLPDMQQKARTLNTTQILEMVRGR
jgi:uncharacterized protein (DUF697 family)/tellurite resistance protein